MNAFEKYNKMKQELTEYKNLLAEYDGSIATKKVIAKLDKIIKEK